MVASVLGLLSAVCVEGLIHPPFHKLVHQPNADLEVYEYKAARSGLQWWHQEGTHKSTGRPYSAFVAIVNNPNDLHIALPNNTCSRVAQTSTTAREHQCLYAINAGFFDIAHHKCIGNVVYDGKQVQLPATATANFGLAHDAAGRPVVVTGYLNKDMLTNGTFKWAQLVSGVGWLVRGGKSYVRSAPDLDVTHNFVTEKAPRTAVGFFAKNSSLLILEVDGEEDIDAGPDLFEMTELLLELGVETAVNLDGGGSAVAVFNGKVISQPTCDDTPRICERDVTSILCVKGPRADEPESRA